MGSPSRQAFLNDLVRATSGFRMQGDYAIRPVEGAAYCVWSFCINRRDYRVEFCETRTRRHPVFDTLSLARGEVEWVFGGPLLWEVSLPGRARVAHVVDGVGWETDQRRRVDRVCTDMVRLRRAMEPFLGPMGVGAEG